jgi:hemerythrin
MQSVREVMERVEAGELHHARSLAAELARWFPGHADYLDSALAHWMVKRRHGGKPVVLRRSSAAKGAAAGKPATDAAR